MMHRMRQNTKIILWVVVVAFVVTIFAVWGLDLQTGSPGSDPNVLGKVNGVTITRSQFQFVYEQIANQFRSASPDQSLTYAQQELVSSQAWDNIVYGILTDQEIKRLGISVSDDEIVGYLRNSPPVEVRRFFLDDQGNFDNERYQAALNNPEIDWTQLEQLARERIPRIKLNDYIAAQVVVSEEEIRHEYESQSVDLLISYVQFPFADADIAGYAPSDAEIKTYYDQNSKEFRQPKRARVELIRLEMKPSPSDVEDARFTARRVHEQLLDGEDFADLAKTYSDAASKYVDGDAGFIREGSRPSAYFESLAALEPAELSEPIAVEKSFYVVKLIEKRTAEDGETEYHVQEIQINSALSRQTSDSLFTVAEEIRERAAEAGLAKAAEERGLEVLSPEPLTEDGVISGVGRVPAVNRFAFASAAGAMSDVLRDENNIYIARVAERVPESAKPMAEVRDEIREKLIFRKRKDVTHVQTRAFYNKARGSDFATAVNTYGVTVSRPDTFRVVDNLDNFGRRSKVALAALETPAGEVAPPVEMPLSYAVVEVRARSDVDPADYRKRSPQIRLQLRNQKVQEYMTYWYEKLKAQSRIEDYRT